MRRIAVINQKGGVGKTTTSANLAAALAEQGRRVVVVDMDPQANLSLHLGVELGASKASIYPVLLARMAFADAILPTRTENLFVVPSTIDLSGAELELAATYGRERVLRDCIESWCANAEDGRLPADYVLFDCPPSLGLLSVNALAAATEVLITVQTEFMALMGMSKLVEVVDLIKSRLNPALEVTGILPCLYDSRLRLAREVLGEIRNYFPGQVFRHSIRNNVKLAESPSFGKTIFEYAPESNGALDYRRLALALIAQESRDPSLAELPAPRPIEALPTVPPTAEIIAPEVITPEDPATEVPAAEVPAPEASAPETIAAEVADPEVAAAEVTASALEATAPPTDEPAEPSEPSPEGSAAESPDEPRPESSVEAGTAAEELQSSLRDVVLTPTAPPGSDATQKDVATEASAGVTPEAPETPEGPEVLPEAVAADEAGSELEVTEEASTPSAQAELEPVSLAEGSLDEPSPASTSTETPQESVASAEDTLEPSEPEDEEAVPATVGTAAERSGSSAGAARSDGVAAELRALGGKELPSLPPDTQEVSRRRRGWGGPV